MKKQYNVLIDMLCKLTQMPDCEVEKLVSKPKEAIHGDYTFPVFYYAKQKKANPIDVAKELAATMSADTAFLKAASITQINAIGPYLNFFVNAGELAKHTITTVLQKGAEFGQQVPLVSYNYVLDYSSPNIAKPFGIGHLRSTIIGGAVKRTLEYCGHRVIGINYIGDWGTQFGKVIWAYKKWGDHKKLEAGPIAHLLELYVQFHEEATTNPVMEEEARDIFLELERGNEEYVGLWNQFRALSLTEFDKIYARLNVTFDEYRGESYYNDKMQKVVDALVAKQLLEQDEGAWIVNFEKHNLTLPNAIIVKSNEGSTYLLRDLAAAIDRIESFAAEFLLYEVGAEQKLHFSQLTAILKLLGHDFADRMTHIDHGMYRFKDAKMSTRKGNIILMEDVLDEAVNRVRAVIQEKNPTLAASEHFEQTAQDIGIGAVIFFDLSTDRVKDVAFDWDSILDFHGETGPYVQYTHARICSVLKKYAKKISMNGANYDLLVSPSERELIVHLNRFVEAVDAVARTYEPHTLCRYLLDLSQKCNEYYQKERIITEDEALSQSRILLMASVRQVLENGLTLLGIAAPKAM